MANTRPASPVTVPAKRKNAQSAVSWPKPVMASVVLKDDVVMSNQAAAAATRKDKRNAELNSTAVETKNNKRLRTSAPANAPRLAPVPTLATLASNITSTGATAVGSSSLPSSSSGAPTIMSSASVAASASASAAAAASSSSSAAASPQVQELFASARVACTVCGKLYTKGYMTQHMRIHNNERPFSCDVCGKSFRQKSTRNRHTLIHTGEKPHKCDVCGRAFTYASGLTNHKTVHTGVKNFVCQQCGKKFAKNGTLKTHMRVHTGERPYKCKECGKTFPYAGSLSTHHAVHTGARPFKCVDCGVGFATKSTLKQHQARHDRWQKRFVCKVCNYTFRYARNLRVHKCRGARRTVVSPSLPSSGTTPILAPATKPTANQSTPAPSKATEEKSPQQ